MPSETTGQSPDACEGSALNDPEAFESVIAAVQVLDAPRYAADDHQDNVERLNDAMLEALGAIERALGMFAPDLVASRMASHRHG